MTEQTTAKPDSRTNVHFASRPAYHYLSGIRKPVSSRRDTGLYARYKQVAQAVFGSVCKSDENYMCALIEAAEAGVHFCATDKPIVIDKIVIERNLPRERRNLRLASEGEDGRCHYCSKTSVGLFRFLATGVDYRLCAYHAETFVDGRRWSVVK